jgi:hypothetical protein
VPKGEGIGGLPAPRTKPGICIPWEKKEKEIPQILGDRAIVQRIWEEQEFFGNMFIWQMLLSF